MLGVLLLGPAAWSPSARFQERAGRRGRVSALLEEATGRDALLRLCAATDRGQRCTAEERSRIAALVAEMEAAAPAADTRLLNGNWRLLYASEAVYRSSPFFWAFRQALAGVSTPISIGGGGVKRGDPVSDAIYAITDGLPFYNLGPIYQIFSGVCGVEGCELVYDEGTAPSDGASAEDEPSDGTSDRSAFATAGSTSGAGAASGSLVSRVELRIPLFGFLAPATSIMTTTSTFGEPAYTGAAGAATPIELTLGVQTTSAKQSTLSAAVPQFEPLLGPFPSGDALEAASKGSSKVKLLTTYLTDELRIARPVLSLGGVEADGGIFIYTRSRDAI